MVVVYYKDLQKISGNEAAEEKELKCFKAWLNKNDKVKERILTEPYYRGSKSTCEICFGNISTIGTEDVINKFWGTLQTLDEMMFPNGRVEPCQKEDIPQGAAAAMSVLEANPMFSDMIENVKDTVANLDPNDMGSVIETKEFKKLVKNIQSGLKSGKYKMSDLTGTITDVIGAVQSELNPEMQAMVSSASSMMAAAERGETPDVGKLLAMMKNVSFK